MGFLLTGASYSGGPHVPPDALTKENFYCLSSHTGVYTYICVYMYNYTQIHTRADTFTHTLSAIVAALHWEGVIKGRGVGF